MDGMIAEHGEEGALMRICTRIADGENPVEIARSMGMPWMVMRRWLEDSAERMSQWELAKRCFADGLAYESLREVRDCGLEEVPLARLRSESYVKMAAKVSRVEWGDREDRVSGFGSQGITIVIGSVAVPGLEQSQSGALIEGERVGERIEI